MWAASRPSRPSSRPTAPEGSSSVFALKALNVELGWSLDDIALLEEALFADDVGLDQPMQAPMIDGFICALVSGPKHVAPEQALAWVFDAEHGRQQPSFADPAQAQQLQALLLKQWQATAAALREPERQVYQPLFGCTEGEDGQPLVILDDWCRGYLCGIQLDAPAWQPLLLAHPEWFETLQLYGSEAGWERLEQQPPSEAAHDQAAAELARHAQQIQRYWQGQRDAAEAAAASGAPALCACGSGRPYPLCHGAN